MDSKLSQLNSTWSVDESNALLYVSDSGRDYNITPYALSRSITDAFLPGIIRIPDSAQVLSEGGFIDTDTTITELKISSTGTHKIELPEIDPSEIDSLVKIIIVTEETRGGKFVLSGNCIINEETREFETVTDTAILLYYIGIGKWIFLK